MLRRFGCGQAISLDLHGREAHAEVIVIAMTAETIGFAMAGFALLLMCLWLRAYTYLGGCVCIAHESFKTHLLYGNRSVLPFGPFFSLRLVFEDSVAGSFTVRVGDYDPNVLILTLRFFLTHGHV